MMAKFLLLFTGMAVTRSEEVAPMQATVNEILTCPDPLIGMFIDKHCFYSVADLSISKSFVVNT